MPPLRRQVASEVSADPTDNTVRSSPKGLGEEAGICASHKRCKPRVAHVQVEVRLSEWWLQSSRGAAPRPLRCPWGHTGRSRVCHHTNDFACGSQRDTHAGPAHIIDGYTCLLFKSCVERTAQCVLRESSDTSPETTNPQA